MQLEQLQVGICYVMETGSGRKLILVRRIDKGGTVQIEKLRATSKIWSRPVLVTFEFLLACNIRDVAGADADLMKVTRLANGNKRALSGVKRIYAA